MHCEDNSSVYSLHIPRVLWMPSSKILRMDGNDFDKIAAPNRTKSTTDFSPQVIAFALFGTISKFSQVTDTVAQVSKQFPDIPDIFKFEPSTVQFNSVGVFCRQMLNQGAVLGPFTGRKLRMADIDKLSLKSYWEIHQDGKPSYCLDGSDPLYRNWMYFIQYARNQEEQNLLALQYDETLYFRAMRNINEGEELLVWYDKNQYNLYMGIPQGFDGDKVQLSDEEIDVVSDDEEIEDDDTDDDNTKHDSTELATPYDHDTLTKSHSIITGVPFPQTTPPSGNSAYNVYSFSTIPNVHWIKPTCYPTVRNSVLPMAYSWPNFPLSPPQMAKSSNLDMFERWADGTRWRCQICQRIFTSQGSLRAHARIHTGEKPYQCKFCKRVFTQASTLRSHERLHTGEKPYKCDHCGKAFTQSAGLRSHLKTHNPIV